VSFAVVVDDQHGQGHGAILAAERGVDIRVGPCMPARRAGSANGMDHEYRLPARVVEVTRDRPDEDDPETEDTLPPPPAATDDGTPVSAAAQRPAHAR
jgi:hypothetical protein